VGNCGNHTDRVDADFLPLWTWLATVFSGCRASIIGCVHPWLVGKTGIDNRWHRRCGLRCPSRPRFGFKSSELLGIRRDFPTARRDNRATYFGDSFACCRNLLALQNPSKNLTGRVTVLTNTWQVLGLYRKRDGARRLHERGVLARFRFNDLKEAARRGTLRTILLLRKNARRIKR
jgi:hypothetical protein